MYIYIYSSYSTNPAPNHSQIALEAQKFLLCTNAGSRLDFQMRVRWDRSQPSCLKPQSKRCWSAQHIIIYGFNSSWPTFYFGKFILFGTWITNCLLKSHFLLVGVLLLVPLKFTQVHISVAQNCMLVAEIHMFVIQICMFPYFLLKSLDPYFSALKSRYFCFSAPRFLCTRVPETLLGTLWWPVSFRTPQAPIPAQRSNEFWQKSWESQFQMATEMTSHGSIRMDIYMLEITYLIHLDR